MPKKVWDEEITGTYTIISHFLLEHVNAVQRALFRKQYTEKVGSGHNTINMIHDW